ncbi:MAG: DUF5947 family protein [Xanthobacteraceae bacterium]
MESTSLQNWVSRVRHFVARNDIEHCDFCSIAIPHQHTHLIERATRQFHCACQGCALSLGESARYCSVSPRTDVLHDFHLTDAQWNAFQIPIDMVFLFQSTTAGRPIAIYPSPAGPTESLLSLDAWSALVEANRVLADLEPDVEALLVNRTNGAREYYRVSIDRCYALVGLIRTHWRGLSGGTEAWGAVHDYFAKLRDSSRGPAGDLIHG